ncbi:MULTISPECIES: hypothetical protein [Cohnella]|uniref:hypothetical protein n=1 Tax=Cohnella TaxID=329857 RepID=UPI0009BB104A|nr:MULTISPECIES: hypothetical protein [Cohnella]MBN2982043.1 hypothetical protein [Cohnella algarum]
MSAALMFQFPNESAAKLAFDTLQELGYDPQAHEQGRLHIHVVREDLASALEIVQSHGGELLEESSGEAAMCADDAYEMDAIPIPAHTVNEDWASLETYTAGDVEEEPRFDPDPESYDHFEAR